MKNIKRHIENLENCIEDYKKFKNISEDFLSDSITENVELDITRILSIKNDIRKLDIKINNIRDMITILENYDDNIRISIIDVLKNITNEKRLKLNKQTLNITFRSTENSFKSIERLRIEITQFEKLINSIC